MLKKTWIIIAMTLICAASLSFAIASFIYTAYRRTFLQPEFLSRKTIELEVSQVKIPSIESTNFYIGELCDMLVNSGASISVLYDLDGRNTAFAIYFSDMSDLSLRLISGRVFTDQDVSNNKNTIIISEAFLQNCRQIEGRWVYSFNGSDYDVIGVYKRYGNDVDYYVNLSSENLRHNIIVGRCYIEGQDNKKFIVENLNKEGNFLIETIKDYSELSAVDFVIGMKSSFFVYFIVFSPLLTLILSLAAISKYLVNVNREALYVHVICGATYRSIYSSFRIKTWFVAAGAFLAVLALYILISIGDNSIFSFNYYAASLDVVVAGMAMTGMVAMILITNVKTCICGRKTA
ncbi:MAG: hypothetical protein LBU32_32065 [Clostridiales bacterium]|nr:hypothetical protein [Clostridiales bacterium]